MPEPILSLFAQIPAIAIFVWFTLRQNRDWREHLSEQANLDRQSREKRDADWRDFFKDQSAQYALALKEQRERDNLVLLRLADEIKHIGIEVSKNQALIIAHDTVEQRVWDRWGVMLAKLEQRE